jgi:CheY-like chemotaxis protein
MSLENVRILVVDDDDLLRDTIKDVLELDRAIVSEAADGAVAFDMIKSNIYDVVLTDIRMPECSGIELLAMVQEYTEKTPQIILMTAFTDISPKEARDLGARALFLKPGKATEIKDLILEII